MVVNKLQVDYDFDFLLVALNSNVKPYKLAWYINRALEVTLVMKENIQIEFKKNKNLYIQNYEAHGTHYLLRLLKNRAEDVEDIYQAYLLPELKNFDYFLLLENDTNTFDEKTFLNQIKEIPFVQFATQVDAETLKSRDNLIF